jgi:hypothetical protein
LTDSLSGIQAGYAAAQRQAQMARAQALGQVVNNYYAQPAPASAPPPPGDNRPTTGYPGAPAEYRVPLDQQISNPAGYNDSLDLLRRQYEAGRGPFVRP